MAALRQHDTFSVLADAASGILAGCCSTVVGQPFDTVRAYDWCVGCSTGIMNLVWCFQVKVRLQTHSAFYNGPIDCARQTVTALLLLLL